jgi:hypothetical protein
MGKIDCAQFEFLGRTRAGAELLELGRLLNLYLIADVYGLHHEKRDVVRFPADWWQAFKERWAPLWFRMRYPVIYTEVTVSMREIYPDIAPKIPDKRHTFVFHTMRRNYECEF